MLEAMRTRYREVRREVYHEATRPASADVQQHERNRERFRVEVLALCDRANLMHYDNAMGAARRALWHHLWTKNRYAGIRAQTARTEIDDISVLFDNYAFFLDPGWNIESKGYEIQAAGPLARDFLDRTGAFAGRQTIGNVPKLKKLILVARQFNEYFEEHQNASAISFVTRDLPQDNVWDVQQQLLAIGYKGDLTALHFMMDAGFQVIKPDLVLSRLFLDWGWLRFAIPTLPADITRDDLIGRGNYGTKYLYFKPRIYRPIINLARIIVQELDTNLLEADIGWVTNNPIREFDIFLVKAGQMPEEEFGIERRLYP